MPVTMAGTHYAKSIRLACTSEGQNVVYSTSGYSRLHAKVGVPADSPDAIGSVGSVQDLSVDISGQGQIRIACVMTKSGDTGATYFYSGLGDAELS